MADNLRIWNALSKTDPKHTKPFTRGGGFKGTATKPIWLTMRLTEHFGPAGTGWGMGEPSFQVVNAGDEILVFCTVSLWYREGETLGTVYGVGGDKVLAKRQSGSFTNDEAFKASYTDALSNAMKQIGVAADIHMGLFDDSKYRDEVGREFANNAAPFASNALEQAHADIVEQTGNTQSQYQVDKRKAAIAAGWKVTNKTYKGGVDQIHGYFEMAGTVEEVAAILNANEDFIAKAQEIDKEEIETGGAKLIEWLEQQTARGKAA